MMNNRQKLIAGLQALGFKQSPCKSRKYLRFERDGKRGCYFVGKSGALRFSEDCVVTRSHSYTGSRIPAAIRACVGCTSAEQAQQVFKNALSNRS